MNRPEELIKKIYEEQGQIKDVFFTACGGSLVDLYPGFYFINAESETMHSHWLTAKELIVSPSKFLKKGALVILSLGPELVSLTRGSKGCIMYDGEQFYTQPATLIDNVVDTMGAGDSFLTSFMDCYIDQLKRGTDRQEAIRTSLKEASKFAAHVCTLNGAFGYGKPYED